MRISLPSDFDAKALAGFHWHQSWNAFPNLRIPGRSPVELILERCSVPEHLDGKRVIDVGAWNGCTSFECERRGAAEVVAFSLEDPSQSGFNFLRDLLESKVKYVQGSIYDLDPQKLGLFDIVLCFGVIYHLRYPILGLDNLRLIARGQLFLESHVTDSGIESERSQKPTLEFYPRGELANERSNWNGPNLAALNSILESGGFEIVKSSVQGGRGYIAALVAPGMPEFLRVMEGDTYENLFYDLSLKHLFGSKDQWRR